MISLIIVSIVLAVFGYHATDISLDARVIITSMCILSDLHLIIRAISI